MDKLLKAAEAIEVEKSNTDSSFKYIKVGLNTVDTEIKIWPADLQYEDYDSTVDSILMKADFKYDSLTEMLEKDELDSDDKDRLYYGDDYNFSITTGMEVLTSLASVKQVISTLDDNNTYVFLYAPHIDSYMRVKVSDCLEALMCMESYLNQYESLIKSKLNMSNNDVKRFVAAKRYLENSNVGSQEIRNTNDVYKVCITDEIGNFIDWIVFKDYINVGVKNNIEIKNWSYESGDNCKAYSVDELLQYFDFSYEKLSNVLNTLEESKLLNEEESRRLNRFLYCGTDNEFPFVSGMEPLAELAIAWPKISKLDINARICIHTGRLNTWVCLSKQDIWCSLWDMKHYLYKYESLIKSKLDTTNSYVQAFIGAKQHLEQLEQPKVEDFSVDKCNMCKGCSNK